MSNAIILTQKDGLYCVDNEKSASPHIGAGRAARYETTDTSDRANGVVQEGHWTTCW